MMMDRMSRMQLLCWIDQVSFACIELCLYLDTHPHDEKALSAYCKNNKLRKEAVLEYQREYGPLILDGACQQDCDCWLWAEQPWPWEKTYYNQNQARIGGKH
ncbi:MAG: spore coat protein CotJB [Lachnospiraceae bacterium]|nr:spore coat protein CotJB [Lachnospiraceae bacterium]MDD3614589.1 spore coat protein CotJB [Lachnospiraceae bacterium]